MTKHSDDGDPPDNAFYDDESFSEDELASFEEAHWEYLRGETFSQQDIKRRYGIGESRRSQDGVNLGSSMDAYLDAAPYDDEEVSPESIRAIKTALEEAKRGEVYSREEIIREFDLG